MPNGTESATERKASQSPRNEVVDRLAPGEILFLFGCVKELMKIKELGKISGI